jgi:F-type H+-transporting ATPase subunit delta
MPRIDDRQIALARVYSGAMLELAERAGQAEPLLEELLGVATLVEREPDLAAFFSSPLIEDEARREVIEKVLRGHASDLLVDSLQVINVKGRLDLLPTIAEAYRQAFEALRGRIEVKVESAVALDPEQRAALAESVRRSTGKHARLVETVDQALLAGLVVRVGDEKFDGSAANQLRKLAATLLERASQEIQHGVQLVDAGDEG